MDNPVENRRAFIINFTYFGIIVALYVVLVKFAFGYIFPFVFAATLAVLLQKPIRKIGEKLHIKAHGALSLVIVLLIVVVVIGAITGALTLLIRELTGFFNHIFSQFDSFEAFLSAIEKDLMGIAAKLPRDFSVTVGQYITNFFDKVSANGANIDFNVILKPLLGAWDVVKGIPSMLLSILVTIISCVFMTSEYGEIKGMILGFCSEEKGRKLIHAKKTVMQGVGKIFKAYATIMVITFTEMFLGLSLMKALHIYAGDYIPVIAFVTCIVDIVPVLGTGTILIPWALYCFITGELPFGFGLIILYAVITVLRQIIEPRLVAHQVGLPAIITIMAMFIGAKVFGPLGIVLVPLTVVVIKLMYDDGIIGQKNKDIFKKECMDSLEEDSESFREEEKDDDVEKEGQEVSKKSLKDKLNKKLAKKEK